MSTTAKDFEKRLLATTVFELRLLLAGQLEDDGPVGDAARMGYALHNQALAVLEEKPFNVSDALQRLERFEPRLGRKYLDHFAKVVRDET
ncbi:MULTISPECIES: hypothetical protein [Xanthomonas]|uniref:hypothetical protein n=1 Tax=Xanthomonas TaxID=338 RepID=UPI000E1F0D8E|nr:MULTISPECIES: hypothetical protein [Xanthomonas]